MRHWKSLLIGVSLLAAVFLGAKPRPVDATPGRGDAEVARLRGHFAMVLAELRAAPVSHLTRPQVDARRVLIERLEGYAATGRFPHNHDVADRYVPVFRDGHATLCAMGYLIASTGRMDIVNDVAARRNLAFLPELADDARLVRWLDSTGVTLAEAARIQPMYEGCGWGNCPEPEPPSPSREYRAASITGAALSGALILANTMSFAPGERAGRRLIVTGALTALAQVALGTHGLRRGDSHDKLAAVNIAGTAVSLASIAWRATRKPPGGAPGPIALVPILDADRQRAGLVLSLTH